MVQEQEAPAREAWEDLVEVMRLLEMPALHQNREGILWGHPMPEGRWFVEPCGRMIFLNWEEAGNALAAAIVAKVHASMKAA